MIFVLLLVLFLIPFFFARNKHETKNKCTCSHIFTLDSTVERQLKISITAGEGDELFGVLACSIFDLYFSREK